MEMIEKINLANRIVSSRFDKNNEHYGLYFLGCYGLLSKFGDNYLELVERLFKECDFRIANKSLKELVIEKYGYWDDKKMEDPKYEILAISRSGVTYRVNDNLEFELFQTPTVMFISTCNISINLLLNSFIHESSHILKTMLNCGNIIDNDNITRRAGLTVEHISRLWEKYVIVHKCNNLLDEIVNVFQTSEMMDEIGKLDRNLLDDEVKQIFDKLDFNTIGDFQGYNDALSYFEPLWENSTFKNSIEENIVIGNIEKIESDFNEVMGEDRFRDFSKLCDQLLLRSTFVAPHEEALITSVVKKYIVNSKNGNGSQKVKC